MKIKPHLEKTESAVDRLIPFKRPAKDLISEQYWQYRVCDGLGISHLEIRTDDALALEYEKDCPTLNFGFILSGTYRHRIKAPVCNGKEYIAHEGVGGIAYLPRQEGCLTIPRQTHLSVVHIHVDLAVFSELFYDDRDTVPAALLPLFDGPVQHSWIFRTGMSIDAKLTLNRLLQGPSPGTPAHIFFQGITLDLMAEQVNRANTSRQIPGSLSHDEVERVLLARNILIEHVTDPPCLKQLSRKIGLNMNKLQQGFQQLYGVSVFKFLHQYRMQEAQRIFHETDMNVSQAASAVGYTNISHFSHAYKQHFNILPKRHLAVIRNG